MGTENCLEKVCFKVAELNVSNEHIECEREFQIAREAAWEERELKVRLVRGTYTRLAEKDDLRTPEGQRGSGRRELYYYYYCII